MTAFWSAIELSKCCLQVISLSNYRQWRDRAIGVTDDTAPTVPAGSCISGSAPAFSGDNGGGLWGASAGEAQTSDGGKSSVLAAAVKPAAKRAQYPPHLSAATPLWGHPFMTSAQWHSRVGVNKYPKFVDKQHVDFKNRGGWGKTKQKIQKFCGSPVWMAPTFLSFIQSFTLRYHYSPLNFESQVISRFSPTRSFVSLRYSAVA